MIRGRKTVGALALAGLALWLTKQPVLLDEAPAPVEPVHTPPAPPAPPTPPAGRSWRRRAALTLAYTTLFFAGAAVVAGAGNELAQVDPESTGNSVVVATDAMSTDTTTTATDVTTTTTTDATTDAAATTTATTATDATAPVTTPDRAPAAPDPSDATPPVAADTGAPTAAPAPTPTHAAPVAAHRRHAAAHKVAAAPASSPFPVLAFDPQAWLVSSHPGTPTGNAASRVAEQYLGASQTKPGGNAPSTGFDCSGLTQFVYAQLGVWLPHYAAAQFLAYPRTDPTQLEPGDLVFFEPKPDGPGDVAIYAGGDVIVEAPHTGAVVRLGSLSGAATALGFLGAVRPSGAAASSLPVTLPAVRARRPREHEHARQLARPTRIATHDDRCAATGLQSTAPNRSSPGGFHSAVFVRVGQVDMCPFLGLLKARIVHWRQPSSPFAMKCEAAGYPRPSTCRIRAVISR